MAPEQPVPKKTRLTPRKTQVLRLLAEGLTNKEIAYRMGLAEGTVKVYLSHILDLTGFRSRVELIRAMLAGKLFVPGVNVALESDTTANLQSEIERLKERIRAAKEILG